MLLPALPSAVPWVCICAEQMISTSIQETAMTNKQRLTYSILIALTVLAIMLGLSHLQNSGVITEKTFQYIAIAVAVLVVIINGFMRRKVKH
jgi:predicted tellurium resistance membrane protein TerC